MPEETPQPTLSTMHRVLAASVGGVITALIMTPLDVVKIRLQSDTILAKNKCFIYCNGLTEHLCPCVMSKDTHVNNLPWYRRPGNFNGTLDAFLRIVRAEGLSSLWSGLSPTLAMALPQTVIYYSVNDWLKERVGYSPAQSHLVPKLSNQDQSGLSTNDFIPAFAGGVSRIFAVAAISPIELLRTKMQSIRMSPAHLSTVIIRAVKQSGPSSLWLGMGPTLLRDIPYSMVFWFVFDGCKSSYMITGGSAVAIHQNSTLHFSHAFLFGAVSGLVAGVITHPFDVIKTHRQIQLGEMLIGTRPAMSSTWSHLRNLYKTSGTSALYAGFIPRLVKTTNASAVMVATFETFKGYFASHLSRI